MSDSMSSDELAAEFDALLARAGVKLPAERRAGVVATYRDFRDQIALLHAVRPGSAEPSNVYRMPIPKAGR